MKPLDIVSFNLWGRQKFERKIESLIFNASTYVFRRQYQKMGFERKEKKCYLPISMYAFPL